MKLLIYAWNTFAQDKIIKEWNNLGHETTLFEKECLDYNEDTDFSNTLREVLEATDYDAVFSFNYFPVISEVCMETGMKYISWVFDSPLLTLYSNTVFYVCNYIFHFDKMQVEELRSRGISTIYYLPLGVSTAEIEERKKKNEAERTENYENDVSFVGTLYKQKNFYDQIRFIPEYLKGYLEGIMAAQQKIYGVFFIEQLLDEKIIQSIRKYAKFDLGENYFAEPSKIFATLFLGQKITSEDRISILNFLSKEFSVVLYSDDIEPSLGDVEQKGYINYNTEMPRVFQSSKINLNITLRTIQSGIPLRIWDIIENEGFVITNYQSELCELFVAGEDLVIYDSLEDLREKVAYYLAEEEERKAIAKRGAQKARQYHSYQKRICDMLDMIEQDQERGTFLNIMKAKIRYLLKKNKREEAELLFQKKIVNKEKKEFDTELATIEVLFRIYKLEQGKPNTILDYSDELDEVILHFTRLKFYLRRLEFELPLEKQKEFVDYTIINAVSYQAISAIIRYSIIEKAKVFEKAAILLEESGQRKLALPLLLQSERMGYYSEQGKELMERIKHGR